MNNDVTMKNSIANNANVMFRVKRKIYYLTKRVFDIVFSLIGLILLVPTIIAVKICCVLSGDLYSIFYTQDRIGKNGKIFKLYKFRSMIPHADEELEKILASDEAKREEYRINKKLKDDPRITFAGKFLRKSSLDELPQLLNIFLGDMTFIGNRPYLPREKSDMGMHFDKIVSTKPGLTGYWQVSGRSDTTFKERLELEEYYSEHCNLLFDIKIFFKTFAVVLGSKGSR